MRLTVIASPAAPHQLAHRAALADGLRSLGVTPVLAHTARSCDTLHVACWGWRMGKALRDAGHEVLVIERGYIGNRFAWSSLAWNGLNGRARFAESPDDGGARFREHFHMQPWRTEGASVLVMGQVPGDASLQGRDMYPWYIQAATEAAHAYGLPVHYRPHPLSARKGAPQSLPNALGPKGTLEEALAQAAVVVTFNSNSGVDAALAGVPVVAADPGSMAWPVAAHRIGDRVLPDREEWAHALAWKQWRLDEIASGKALRGLMEVADG